MAHVSQAFDLAVSLKVALNVELAELIPGGCTGGSTSGLIGNSHERIRRIVSDFTFFYISIRNFMTFIKINGILNEICP